MQQGTIKISILIFARPHIFSGILKKSDPVDEKNSEQVLQPG